MTKSLYQWLYEFGAKTPNQSENRGGKSVILQLALQVVLPNTNMGKQKFPLFKTGTSPYYGEWLDTGADYVLTGICFGMENGLRFLPTSFL